MHHFWINKHLLSSEYIIFDNSYLTVDLIVLLSDIFVLVRQSN